jgi:hypothetical protein
MHHIGSTVLLQVGILKLKFVTFLQIYKVKWLNLKLCGLALCLTCFFCSSILFLLSPLSSVSIFGMKLPLVRTCVWCALMDWFTYAPSGHSAAVLFSTIPLIRLFVMWQFLNNSCSYQVWFFWQPEPHAAAFSKLFVASRCCIVPCSLTCCFLVWSCRCTSNAQHNELRLHCVSWFLEYLLIFIRIIMVNGLQMKVREVQGVISTHWNRPVGARAPGNTNSWHFPLKQGMVLVKSALSCKLSSEPCSSPHQSLRQQTSSPTRELLHEEDWATRWLRLFRVLRDCAHWIGNIFWECIHHPDDGGSTHLWNVSLLQQDCMALHPRRL